MQGKLKVYRSQLRAALEVHAFNRDVDDTCDRIQEKLAAVTSDDLGRDLHSVEALLRKQEAVERDMTVIHEKLKVKLCSYLLTELTEIFIRRLELNFSRVILRLILNE